MGALHAQPGDARRVDGAEHRNGWWGLDAWLVDRQHEQDADRGQQGRVRVDIPLLSDVADASR
jgi:hypothetical protein